MATYVIEGTISELTKNGGIAIRISGSEGYSVKQDKKKYNVFRYQYSQDKSLPTTGEVAPCYIADSQFELPIGVKMEYENILAQALVSGKRVRLTLEVDDTKTLEEYVNAKQPLPLKSVTLLQN